MALRYSKVLPPKEPTLAKARAGLFQGERTTWLALPQSNL
jgi:hypothetical protein